MPSEKTSGRDPIVSKPRVFLASSSEAGDLLTHLSVLVSEGNWCLVQAWHFAFEPGKSFLSSLVDNTAVVDFAVILYTGDDQTTSRGTTQSAPRDNVIFELGFFIAKLGSERVIVVSPQKIPKLPSDYSGISVITYDNSEGTTNEYLATAGMQIKLHLKRLWDKRNASSVITPDALPDPTSTVDIVYKPSSGGIIPIYRDTSSVLDWFAEFQSNIRPPFRYLNSQLTYYGPGLAKFWFQRARRDAANRAMATALQQELQGLLSEHRYTNVNIIDLGIGDFEKGHIILDYYLRDPQVETINYFPLDVSYEMLGLALQTRVGHFAATTLEGVQQSGSITAINASFSQLSRYSHLFSRPSKNIFLLLGNTLGNESNEDQTLKDISDGMDVDDLLIIEVQLIEVQPPTLEEENRTIQQHKDFYCGPFWAVHYDIRDIDLSVRSKVNADSSVRIPGRTLEIVAKLNKPLTAVDPGFSGGSVTVSAGESIVVYLIRLYEEGAVEELVRRSGFELLSARMSSRPDPTARRFSYLLVRKLA